MNRSEKEHLSRVAALGCIVCRNEGMGDTPAEIHHLRDGQGRGQRASHFETLPLCAIHHRTGDGKGWCGGHIGYHFHPPTFEERYGTERELLEEVCAELNISCPSRSL